MLLLLLCFLLTVSFFTQYVVFSWYCISSRQRRDIRSFVCRRLYSPQLRQCFCEVVVDAAPFNGNVDMI